MASEIQADPAVVQLANELSKLPFWAEFDAEAAIGKFRESLLKEVGNDLDADGFQKLWLALGYDKVLSGGPPPAAEPAADAPPPEEGAEAAPAPAPAAPSGPVVTSENHKAVWALLTRDAPPNASKHSVQYLLGTLALCKGGYSEGTFRTVLKLGDHAGIGAAKEGVAWTAITRCANRADALNPTVRSHLRKAWRKAEKYQPPAPEGAGGEGGEGGEAAPSAAPVVPPADMAALLDSLVTALQEDELLAEVLLKEVPVPIAPPPEAAEGEGAAE